MKNATMQFQAVQQQKAERAAADPMRAMGEYWLGKLVGLGLLWWGQHEWAPALKTEGRFDEWAAVGAGLVGLWFLLPTGMRSLVALVKPLVPWVKKTEVPSE